MRDDNPRGVELEEFIFEQGLFVQNIGSTPTWRGIGGLGSTIIDITLTLNCGERVSNWQVLPEQTLSDHKMISFKVDKPNQGWVLKRNYSKANWELFSSYIVSELKDPPLLWSNSLIELSSVMITKVITKALDIACPEHKVKQRDKLFWWNQKCNNAKSHYLGLERKMLKSLKNQCIAHQVNCRVKVRQARRAFMYRVCLNSTKSLTENWGNLLGWSGNRMAIFPQVQANHLLL